MTQHHGNRAPFPGERFNFDPGEGIFEKKNWLWSFSGSWFT